ncbi:hypothetical protein C2S52_018890 [Perilla frutescens var. hirtella]|nr:hypothetical protein C2S52_018890 [Perilla frutescens var. hirtella]
MLATTSSRDNWERLVAAVLKRDQIWQLCHQDSATTVVSSDLSRSSSYNSRLRPTSINDSVIQVRKNASGTITRKLLSALPWIRKPKDDYEYLVSAERFPLRTLLAATHNFSSKNIIGRGGHSTVYKGQLADGTLVAVKRYEQPVIGEEFEIITKVSHRNIVHLLGFCITQKEQLLVFPYMANGSVASCLRGERDGEHGADKEERGGSFDIWGLSVACGCFGEGRKSDGCGSTVRDGGGPWRWGQSGGELEADMEERGGRTAGGKPDPKTIGGRDWGIIHCDIKAANILLDEDLKAFVADFTLAKLMDCNHDDGIVKGTIGHIAPEYLSTGKCSQKADVFGYGVFLLELITGKKSYDPSRAANGEDVMLLDWVKKYWEERNLKVMVDGDLLNGNFVAEHVEKLLQLALICTHSDPERRPMMPEVLRMLEGDDLSEWWDEWRQYDFKFEFQIQYDFKETTEWIILDSTSNIRPQELSGPR